MSPAKAFAALDCQRRVRTEPAPSPMDGAVNPVTSRRIFGQRSFRRRCANPSRPAVS